MVCTLNDKIFQGTFVWERYLVVGGFDIGCMVYEMGCSVLLLDGVDG